MYRVILVDDHPFFRAGFRHFLSSLDNIETVSVTEKGSEFLNKLTKEHFDIAFIDISMPVIDGFEAAAKALEIQPHLKIISISSHEDIGNINKMIQCGASGYITKDAGQKEIAESIACVMNGESYFSPGVLMTLTKDVVNQQQNSKTNSPEAGLTDRETEILVLISKGLSRGEIADRLCISERTFDKHRENLLLKTGTKNTVSLLMHSIKKGLIQAV